MEDLTSKIKRYVTLKAQIESLESELEPIRESLLNELKEKNKAAVQNYKKTGKVPTDSEIKK
jgi:prefoldin subunit 5